MANRPKKSVSSSPPMEHAKARIPASPGAKGLPVGYAGLLTEIKERIRAERVRVVLAANAAMVSLYWDIGRLILNQQRQEGWGAKVIDRLLQTFAGSFPICRDFPPATSSTCAPLPPPGPIAQ